MKTFIFKFLFTFIAILLISGSHAQSTATSASILAQYPNLNVQLAAFFATTKGQQCITLAGFVDQCSPDEQANLALLTDASADRCFRRPSSDSELQSEKDAFTNIANNISAGLTASSIKMRNTLSAFDAVRIKFSSSNDIVYSTRTNANVFLSVQSNINSCIADMATNFIKILAASRALLYTTIIDINNSCILDSQSKMIQCSLSANNTVSFWSTFNLHIGCFERLYNEYSLNMYQSRAIVSQYQGCRIDGNSNLSNKSSRILDSLTTTVQATTTTNTVASTNASIPGVITNSDSATVTVVIDNSEPLQYTNPTRGETCSSPSSPNLSTVTVNMSDSTPIANEFTNVAIKNVLAQFIPALKICTASSLSFNSNGKPIIPLPQTFLTGISQSIGGFQAVFTTSDGIRIGNLMTSVVDPNSNYELTCTRIGTLISSAFRPNNYLFSIYSNAFLATTIASATNFWYLCEYDTTNQVINCACKSGDCTALSANAATSLELNTGNGWIENYTSITISIYKIGASVNYFAQMTVDHLVNGVTTTESKFEFNLNGVSSNSIICSQVMGCNKMNLSNSQNTVSERAGCSGAINGTCSAFLNTAVINSGNDDFNNNLIITESAPFENTNEYSNYVSSFFLDVFSVGGDIFEEVPDQIGFVYITAQATQAGSTLRILQGQGDSVDQDTAAQIPASQYNSNSCTCDGASTTQSGNVNSYQSQYSANAQTLNSSKISISLIFLSLVLVLMLL